MIFWSPVFFILPREDCWKIAKMWAFSHLWFHNRIVGTRFDFRGTENIPQDSKGLIVASKHQSAWETYTLILFFSDAAYVLKRELTYIPLFGWLMAKMKVVPIDRGRGREALAKLAVHARQAYGDGRQIIIYPEGTRKAPGAEPAYKFGVSYLYDKLGARVLPVALNAGLFWRRNSFMREPGTIILEFLPVIPAGINRDEFAEQLKEAIESKSDDLIGTARPESINP